MTTLIADCETDGFVDHMTRIWCIQIGGAEDDEVTVYADQPGFPPLKDAVARLRAADRVVMHNGQAFDLFAINKIFPGTLTPHQVWDSMLASQLMYPERQSHSLKAWGVDLKEHKGEHEDWTRFTKEMVEYARQDIVVTRKLYHRLLARPGRWDDAIELENLFAHIIELQRQNGFTLDMNAAIDLSGELRQEKDDLEHHLQEIFPPRFVKIEEKTPKQTRKIQGLQYTEGCPYTKIKLQHFNPGSRAQIADRLIRLGWKPRAWSPSGAVKIDDAILEKAGAQFKEAARLARYFRVAKLLGQISDGDNAWLKLVTPKGRVHGRVITLGTGTGRCSHNTPNMAQVDKKDLRMRACWVARNGWKLVGVDAEGLELRMLAHYVGKRDGGALARALLEGDKSQGTDAHTINQRAAGLHSRDQAKRLLYALMYGAGDAKLGSIVQDDARLAGKPKPKGNQKQLGVKARDGLAKGIKGLDVLTKSVKSDADRKGFIVALDGRRLKTRSSHSALNFLLQGGGAIVMKRALVIFHFNYAERKYAGLYGYCANVHDEVQSEVHPSVAEDFAKDLADCIRQAGEYYGLRCPLAGAYDIGDNWKDTH